MTRRTFSPVSSRTDFAHHECEILQFWEKSQIFQRSIDQRSGGTDYVFYDGPPGTNGKPHIGHMMQSALKDLWPRYKAMQGYRVLRKAGWDTHGLPVELKAERELNLGSKKEVEEYGVEQFVDYCRDTVFRFKEEWIRSIRRIGRFLDTENDYATLTNDYIQSDWWVFKQAWDKKLVYKDYKVMPYCPRCGTSLSNFELAQGYKDVVDLTLTAKFRSADEDNTFYLAWTTTPWTLLGNVALAVNPNLTYVKVRSNGEFFILVKELLTEVMGGLEYEVLEEYPGSALVGGRYQPLWDFHAGLDDTIHQIIGDDYVTAEDGTGIVHLALYGEDDYRLIRKNNIPMVQHVNAEGRFTAETGPYAGRFFVEEGMDVEILKDLVGRGLLFDKEKHEHSYPHCYKCDTRLMYFSKSSWYIRTTAYKDAMLKANREINWYPAHIKNGRFGKWLENNVDWAISRERFWGSPLPVWGCTNEQCNHQVAVADREELQQISNDPLPEDLDLHIPHIDRIETRCPKCGSPMKRSPEVLDCWYNAGLMPWGQYGYPHAEGSKEMFARQYPADFICEGLDQTRGWFYTMLAVSTLVTGKSSYKNVICTGLVADEHGRKLSKTHGIVVDPIAMFEKYGADAVRWIFYNSHPWQAKRFSEDAIQESLKQMIIPIWNVYSFFITYARIDGWQPGEPVTSTHSLDRWITSETETLVRKASEALDQYDVATAAAAITDYVDSLSNWYVRRSRRRFWKSENDVDKKQAYGTLYQALVTLVKVLAPFVPFITESMYQNLVVNMDDEAPESVHLQDWPVYNPDRVDEALEYDMQLVYKTVQLGRALRSQYQLKVRQPLADMQVVLAADRDREVITEMSHLISEELNVRKVSVSGDEANLVDLSAKANFRVLGKRAGKEMGQLAAAIATLDAAAIAQLESGVTLNLVGYDITISDIVINRTEKEGLRVITQDGITVALNTELTPDLIREGMAREFVNRVQNMRKDQDLDVTQRIRISWRGSETARDAVDRFSGYICSETLAVDLTYCDEPIPESREWSVNEETVHIMVAADAAAD